MSHKSTPEKRKFSSFDTKSAMLELGLEELQSWDLQPAPLAPTDFFHERQARLRGFDLTSSESAKELLIDAILEEILIYHQSLRVWKEAHLHSDTLTGAADYLVAPRRRYLSLPLVCVVEAKRDDFEQGLAQCLVEMKACRERNERENFARDVFGIVTNGTVWQFYRLALSGQVFETAPFTVQSWPNLLGAVNHIFTHCAAGLERNGAGV